MVTTLVSLNEQRALREIETRLSLVSLSEIRTLTKEAIFTIEFRKELTKDTSIARSQKFLLQGKSEGIVKVLSIIMSAVKN
jgi:hypothetical protein